MKLTAEQQNEFYTPTMKEFAESYLDFMHSSPYTSKQKVFKYFQPPKTEDMTNEDLMFGEQRDKAYNRLMANFRVCLFVGDFENFFNEKRNIYYQSKTIPTLVIFRKWLSQGGV